MRSPLVAGRLILLMHSMWLQHEHGLHQPCWRVKFNYPGSWMKLEVWRSTRSSSRLVSLLVAQRAHLRPTSLSDRGPKDCACQASRAIEHI